MATLKDTALTKCRSNKINLKKIVNEEKSSSWIPKGITIKNIEVIKKEEKSTNPEQKDIINISSDTDTFDNLTSISELTTEDSNDVFKIETISSSQEDT